MVRETDQTRAGYFLKIFGVVGAVFGFLWGVYTPHNTANKQLNYGNRSRGWPGRKRL